ncbi:peptidase C14, caspase domain-containing protein [Auriculariales sp. MPI-PUGE-AT-0066]|nr:peptidase C14, caspase domain-containing protein [Auriculariales sp. MPI-PUGE-AT-0066]
MPPTEVQSYGPQYQGHDQQMHQPFFQYSQCNGRKKALIIGVNYTGSSAELAGCHNDARNVQNFLCRVYGYQQNDIVMLLDGEGGHRQQPTKHNLIEAMQWLTRGAQPNDSLFFHFSGHGGQQKESHGESDEVDGFDETIYPVDFEEAGTIVDDELHDIMVKPLPAGCRLTAIFDCCHSGSALDLPYIYSTEGKIKEPNLGKEAATGVLDTFTSYRRGDMSGVMTGVKGLFGLATGSQKKTSDHVKQSKTSPADVISWSGCKDTQTSADTQEAGQATGAMSWAFIASLTERPQQTYQELLVSIRSLLKSKYSQKPQLSSSHPMDVNVVFIC